MLRRRVQIKLSRARVLALTLMLTLFAGSAFGQSTATNKKVAVDEPRPNDVQNEITNLKAENAAVRELLRKMTEQQKALMHQVDRLQKRLDAPGTAALQPTATPRNPRRKQRSIQCR